jgi:Na+-driven multidrug efflux pump
LGVLPNILIALFISLARVQNRSGTIMLVQGTLSLLILGLSYLWLPTLGITGVGVAWLISQTLVALVLLVVWLRPILKLKSAQSNGLHQNGTSHDNS